MATELKRFTISLTTELEQELDRAKQETYYNVPQSEMVRDLLVRGLAVLEQEHRENADGGKTT